jgi:hypothetical protein
VSRRDDRDFQVSLSPNVCRIPQTHEHRPNANGCDRRRHVRRNSVRARRLNRRRRRIDIPRLEAAASVQKSFHWHTGRTRSLARLAVLFRSNRLRSRLLCSFSILLRIDVIFHPSTWPIAQRPPGRISLADHMQHKRLIWIFAALLGWHSLVQARHICVAPPTDPQTLIREWDAGLECFI